MKAKRKFVEGEVNHTYQRTVSGFNIFYEPADYLVYYTIFSITAKSLGVDVYGLCLMIDHIHSLVAAGSRENYSRFMATVTSVFVKEYNTEHGRSGPLFERVFGSAPKLGMKLLRTAIAYLFNNPVERFISRYAQEYRWNFLAYGRSDNPFSEPLKTRHASRSLKRALKEVDGTHARNRHLTYAQLRRMFASLDKEEKNQLIDYIIVRYNIIRYDLLTTQCYDGYENMVLAINSNAGSEYEIKEHKWSRSDVEYRELYQYVHAHGFKDAGDVIVLDIDSKLSMMQDMMKETNASRQQICKFLHLSVAHK
jgi:REP element-mobilizing transposase RayT